MKPSIAVLTLVVGLALGFVAGRAGRPAPLAGMPAPRVEPVATAAAAAEGEGTPTAAAGAGAETRASFGGRPAQGGVAVQALLAGYDRRRPVESTLKVLQHILAAGPDELGELVRGMTGGPWRNDPGWREAKQAALQRWVQVAPDQALAWAGTAIKHGVEVHEAAEVFEVLGAIDPQRAVAAAKAMQPAHLQRQALQRALSAIAQTDPQRALTMSDDLPAPERSGVLRSVYDAWASRDPAAAAASLATIKDPMSRWGGLGAVMQHYAEQDPDGALAWAKQLPEVGIRQQAINQLFQQLGQRDPERGLALAAGLPKSQQLQAHREFVGTWIRNDPAAAEAWILARTNPIEQQQLIMSSARTLAWMDPERASTLVTRMAPGSARDDALREMVGMWNWSAPDRVRDFVQTLPEMEQFRLRPTIAEGLAWRDPDQAIAFLRDNPLDDPAHHAYANLAGAIADQTSPAKALEWAQGLEDEATRLKALPEIFQRMAAQEPAAAARAVLDLPAGAARDESLTRIGGAWAGADFDDALAWARGLTGKDRESALGAVLTQGAPHQPGTAATQYTDMLSGMPAGEKPADSFITAAGTIAGAYFAEDQAKAAAWVSTLPQDDARAAAARTLAENWAQYDAPSASEWIGTLPSGKPRDQAVGALVNRIAASDPAMAFEWAATVQDTSARSSSLEAAFQSWRKLDATAARAAVEHASWPDDEKARWLEKLR